jgi:predicted polyphosphate/ATP-dependent NAD kinase
MKRLGLIINPIAGIGGRVGLKGSDGIAIQQKAIALGAAPQAHLRTARALKALLPLCNSLELITPPGAMGEDIARQSGFNPLVLEMQVRDVTDRGDTILAAREMFERTVDLILFAGGDGTARDICTAIGTTCCVLGIPAGVKIHSAVFSTTPEAAGALAASYVQGDRIRLREAEVLDLDETSWRNGAVSTKLFGSLNVPYRPLHMQNKKAPTPAAESIRTEAIALDVIDSMQPGWLYIVGPGTTTRAIALKLGFPKTLVGVDVFTRESVIALDVNEHRLLQLLEHQSAKIVVAPIGGQGFIFGRGNQPISPEVIKKAGRENIIVISLPEKLIALRGQPLLVDSGDTDVDKMLYGYLPVVTGYHEKVMCKIS